ncbi:MAG TPA: S8 family serine peptidase [Candidatus Eremiobacteraceae bacterium]
MSAVRNPKFISASFIVAAAVSLAACSGGGSTTPGPTPRPSVSPGICTTGQSATRRTINVDGRTYVMASMSKSGLQKWVPGKIYVRFASSTFHQATSNALQSLRALPDGQMDRAGFQVFDIPVGQDVDDAVAAMRGQTGVIRAGKLAVRYPQFLPNDQRFDNIEQWALFQINMPSAWDITKGSANVHIAIIDTGYDQANTDVASKVDLSAVFVTGSPNSSPEDCDGHGTNVSGIAAAVTNNGIGVAGVGDNVHLLEARVFPYGNNPSAGENDIANGINWAVAHGADVINLSLGSPSDDPGGPEDVAVANALTAGVIVVAAAGNDSNYTAIDFPAALTGVISVGATSLNDHGNPNQPAGATEYVAAYSNFSSHLDVVAPGGDPDQNQQNCTPGTAGCPDYLQWILGLYSGDAAGATGPQPDLALFAGTSQATPHVSGLAALMVSKAEADGLTLTPQNARSLIKLHADLISDPHQGSGRINAQATLNASP